MSTRQAIAFSFLDRYAGLVIHIGSSMVLARIMKPAEIGIYSVVMVLLGFVAAFRDFGAGQYLVQNKSASEEVLRATFTVQYGLGLLFAGGLVLGANSVASFYAEPAMFGIMLVLALNFLVTPLQAFPHALLVREMRFGTIATVRFAGAVSHAASAISLAWFGWGAISLAWANLAATLVGIAATALLAHRPMFKRPTRRGLKPVFSFGGTLTIVSLVTTLRTGAPELLIGKLQGMTDAGLLSRAQGLVSMFQQLVLDAVGSVTMPYFSREAREGRPLAEPFGKVLELVIGLGWAFFAATALLAYPMVRFLYGDQWDESVLAVRWLAVASAAALPGLICYPPLVAVGALGSVVKGTAMAAATAMAASVIGAFYGPVVIAQLLIPASLVSSAYWLVLARRQLGFEWPAISACFARSAAVGLATAIVPAVIVLALGWRPAGNALLILLAATPTVLLFVVALRLFKHALWAELLRAFQSISWINRRGAERG